MKEYVSHPPHKGVMFHAITMVEIFPPTHWWNVSDPHTGGNVFISSLEKTPSIFFVFRVTFLERNFFELFDP
jgi:hypothetical protein